MAKRVKRFGRGLNSFLYSPEYEKRQKPLHVREPDYYPYDPNRYLVRGGMAGEYTVMDKDTGETIATQLDSRAEADAWIVDHCKDLKALWGEAR